MKLSHTLSSRPPLSNESTSESILVIYHPGMDEATFILDEEEPAYWLGCHLCGARLDVYDGASIPVSFDSFSEYFGLQEGETKRPAGAFRRRLKHIYGYTCIGCGNEFDENDLTVDHVIAKTHDGDSSPLNLQILCRRCNEQKGDAAVRTATLYLDLLLLPP